MHNRLPVLLVDAPRPATIGLLVALALAALVAALPATRHGLRRIARPTRRRGGRAKDDPARDQRRYAEEVTVAAERGAIRAQRFRERWLAAVDEVDAAWSSFEEADARASRLEAAAVLPEPQTPRTPAEYADRERYLHRAAASAAGRGQLPVPQLNDALANRNGWDPRRHPVEQELILSRANRDAALAAYRAASGRERSAWRDCESAAVAARSLRAEAHAARQAAPGTSAAAPDSAEAEVTTGAAPTGTSATHLRAARAG